MTEQFTLVGARLWLDFVNTDAASHGVRDDVLVDFDRYLAWMTAAGVLDAERHQVLSRRAAQQPAGATAALVDARRVRAALRQLAERGAAQPRIRDAAVAEINRVLARSVGTRRLDVDANGVVQRAFAPAGDAFASLVLPIVESATDALIGSDLARVKPCAAAGCERLFHDDTKNGRRRWCEMRGCGNRAKAARFRAKE
jgi:predicted RNA-binding Zn ribbon-like protein